MGAADVARPEVADSDDLAREFALRYVLPACRGHSNVQVARQGNCPMADDAEEVQTEREDIEQLLENGEDANPDHEVEHEKDGLACLESHSLDALSVVDVVDG